jgi:hypothetical protein
MVNYISLGNIQPIVLIVEVDNHGLYPWLANACENLKSVINTVSTNMFLADSVLRIAWAIAAFAFSLCVISCSALNFATLALTDSCIVGAIILLL